TVSQRRDIVERPDAGARRSLRSLPRLIRRLAPTRSILRMTKMKQQDPVEGAQFVRYFGPLLDALRCVRRVWNPSATPGDAIAISKPSMWLIDSPTAEPRIQQVSQHIAQHVERQHHDADGQAGEDREIRRRLE